MRKGLLYLTISAAVGLLMILIPIFTFTAIGDGVDPQGVESLSRGLRGLEGAYSFTAPASPISDLEILIVSFAVALFVYLLTKRKLSSRRNEWIRMVP